MVYIIMGVAGCGKSTIGRILAAQLGLPFQDADAFHSNASRQKMALGIPLTDADRHPWLKRLAIKIAEWQAAGGAVLACSALKKSYRNLLKEKTEAAKIQFIYLRADKMLIRQRLKDRKNHFFSPALVDSQFKTLEEPAQTWQIEADLPVDEIINQIVGEIHAVEI